MNREISYEDKAQVMYEIAMGDVKDEIDKAWVHIEELATLVGKVTNEALRDQLDEQLSAVMNTLEKI